MQIGEVAERTAESVRTLRYWQDAGLLDAERTESGYRLFPPEVVGRVAFLRGAQGLGLSLQEIRGILDLREEGVRPCDHVRRHLRDHLAAVRDRARKLRILERDLEGRLAWAEAHPDADCDDGCVYLSDAAG